jgi:hypothetical protein
MSDQPVARPVHTKDSNDMDRGERMTRPQVGCEPTNPVFGRSRPTIYAIRRYEFIFRNNFKCKFIMKGYI